MFRFLSTTCTTASVLSAGIKAFFLPEENVTELPGLLRQRILVQLSVWLILSPFRNSLVTTSYHCIKTVSFEYYCMGELIFHFCLFFYSYYELALTIAARFCSKARMETYLRQYHYSLSGLLYLGKRLPWNMFESRCGVAFANSLLINSFTDIGSETVRS